MQDGPWARANFELSTKNVEGMGVNFYFPPQTEMGLMDGKAFIWCLKKAIKKFPWLSYIINIT